MKYKSNTKEVLQALENAQNNALELIGAFVVGEAVLICPVDTGNLRSSISHRVDTKEKSVAIGTPVEYAPYVELGTNKKQAQAYLRPSVENNIDRITKIAQEAMRL